MDDEILNKIESNTNDSTAAFIVCTGKGSKIIQKFDDPIVLDSKYNYSIALTGLQSYFNVPNLTSGKNSGFTLFDFKTKSWHDINLETGSYSLEEINDKVQSKLPDKGTILLYADLPTLKCHIKIQPGYKIMFKKYDISSVLGFDPQILEAGLHVGEHIVNILNVNCINVTCDLVTSSYINGQKTNIIYSFFPDVDIGSKIVQSPKNLLFLPLIVNRIESLTVTLTDQNLDQIANRNENVSCQFAIKRK